MDRRTLLGSGLGLGLVGLATGVAPRWLRGGIPTARAATTRLPTTLILSVSQAGDPLNANAPGAYPGEVTHPNDPEFVAAELELGSQTVTGAAVWGTLPAAMRHRMAFVHHRTLAVAHNEFDRVMRLSGTVRGRTGEGGQEMLASAIAQENAPVIGTVQDKPVLLGPESLTFEGNQLAAGEPESVLALFAHEDPVFDSVRELRDRALDRIYGELKTSGTQAQRAFLDSVAISRERARELGDGLRALLADFEEDSDDGGPRDQLRLAAALASLRFAPVITVNVPFGRDNHSDPELVREIRDTEAGVAHIGDLWNSLVAVGLEDEVTFGMLNVFGRRLDQERSRGRDHHDEHNVLVVAGPNVRGGVVGGLDDELRARGFDLATGRPSESGVPAADTLPVAGATLMAACGVDDETRARRMPGIDVIDAILTG